MNFARLFRRCSFMTDDAWRRHANPWSVYTRFAAIPVFILAIWSRDWVGAWSLVPTAATIMWLIVNPFVFPRVDEPRHWVSKGIFGERVWLCEYHKVPRAFRGPLRWAMALGIFGTVLLIWGLMRLDLWPTLVGAALLTLAQLWRISLFARVYEHIGRRVPEEATPR
jgi:hypothetical protein